MPRPIYLALLFSLKILLVVLSLGFASALPIAGATNLVLRQAGNSTGGPQSVQTVQTTQTVAGPMTQTCTITLTPITDANGNPAVQEVQSCTVTLFDNGSGNVDPGSSLSNSSTSSSSAPSSTETTSSSTDVPGATSSASTPSSSTGSTSSVTSTSTTTSVESSSTTTSVESSSTSTSTNSTAGAPTDSSTSDSTSASTSAMSSPITQPTGPIPARINGFTTIESSALPTIIATPTAAPDNAGGAATQPGGAGKSTPSAAAASSSSAATFIEPGRHLSVLPIGLAVFAGISVIALIVVGLVTYERTKYRKAFRQRKLAEAGSSMGYGGMVERP